MVKLPDQFSAGVGQSMDVRPFSPPNLGLEARAKGLAALAQGFASMAGGMGDAAGAGDKQQDALDLIKADTSFHSGLNDITNGIADNGDYSTHADIYNEKTSQLIPQAAEGIRNPQARELWAARAGLKAVDVGQRVASNAGSMRRQDDVAGLQSQLGRTQAEFLSSQDPASQTDALQRMGHYIDMAQDSRVISPVQANNYRQQFLAGSIQGYADTVPMDRRFQTITGTPLSQYLSGQTAPQQGQPSAGQPGAVTGPAATMLGQPGAQVAPRETAGEILGTPTAEKPLQDRLVPAVSGPQQEGGAQAQTVQNPFLGSAASQQQIPQDNFNAARSNLRLTPEEESFYQRHLTNLYGPGGVDNPDGSRSTVYATQVGLGDKTYILPTVWDGKIHSVDEAVQQARQEGLNKFPSYGTVEEAGKREQAIHSFMERDTSQYMQGRRADAWTSEGMQPAPAPQGGGAAQQQVNPLATARARFAQELTENPALRQKVLAISLGENQDPNGNRAVIESMMNRSSMMNTPLAQEGRTTRENGYYAGYNPRALNNPQLRTMAEQNLEAAIQGSNVSNYATDNSSGQWGRQRNASGMYTQVSTHGDELFSYPSRADARGNGQYWNWREGVGGGTRDNPQTSVAAGQQIPDNATSVRSESYGFGPDGKMVQTSQAAQPGQQRYQLAQAPSNGAPTATDAGYGNNSEPVWNGIKLPRQIDGPLNYMSMPDRMKLLDRTMAEVHKRNGEMYQQTLTDVGNDTAAMARDGTVSPAADGTTAIERARQILRPDDFNKELKKYKAAEYQFKVISPIQDMSEEQYNQHIGQLSPKPGDPDFAVADAIIKKAGENWDKLQTARATDPAGAVDSSNEVLKFKELAANPPVVQQLDGSYARGPVMAPQQMVHGLVQSRLAAQSRLGIDPEYQRIVSQQEASRLLKLGENNKDIKQLSDIDLMQRVKSAANRAEAIYGPEYAKRAVEESMKYLVNDDMRRELGASAAAAVLMGQAPKAEDIRALEMAHTLDPMATMRDTFNGKSGVMDARPDASLGLPAAAVTPPPGMAQPNKQQAAWLSQNPDGWQAFDKKFGAGSAARVLAPGAGYGKTSIQGPVSPGFGQGIKNLFTQSPEAAMFGGAPQSTMRPSDLPGAMEAGQ